MGEDEGGEEIGAGVVLSMVGSVDGTSDTVDCDEESEVMVGFDTAEEVAGFRTMRELVLEVEGMGSAGDSASDMELPSGGFSGGVDSVSDGSLMVTGGASFPTAGPRSELSASLTHGSFLISTDFSSIAVPAWSKSIDTGLSFTPGDSIFS